MELGRGVAGNASFEIVDSAGRGAPLPIELELDMPLVGRARELSWLRGPGGRRAGATAAWSSFRASPRPGSRGLPPSSPASRARPGGDLVRGSRRDCGRARSFGTSRRARRSATALVVLDDFDVTGETVAPTLADCWTRVERLQLLVLGLVRDPDASPRCLTVDRARADSRGDGHRRLARWTPSECTRSLDCTREPTCRRCRSSRSRAPRAACPGAFTR